MRSASNWSQQAYLKSSNSETADLFGASVAISDGTIAIGSTGEDSTATGSNGNQSVNSIEGAGAAYVFRLEVESDSLEISSCQVLSNGDFEIILEESSSNLTVERSNDLSANSFVELTSAQFSVSGTILTISAVAADPENDGVSFFRVISQ